MTTELFPVEQIQSEDVAAEARALQQSIMDYREWVPPSRNLWRRMSGGQSLRYTLFRDAQQARTGRSEWGQRVEAAIDITHEIRGSSQSRSEAYKCVYDSKTAAIIVLTTTQSDVNVDYLVSHPGSSSAAKMLIEKAVNVSDAAGFSGRLSLLSTSSQSTDFYRSMGFVQGTEFLGGGTMRLRPATSPSWTKVYDGTVWRLR